MDLFSQTGQFGKFHNGSKNTLKSVIGNSGRVQMCRHQVVAQLQGWISNRANEFTSYVNNSTLSDDIKHMLHTINNKQAWFLRSDVFMHKTKEVIPEDIRKLARSIIRHAMNRCNRPDLSRISMYLDNRVAKISKPINADQNGRIGYWVKLSTMKSYERRICIPLQTYDYHTDRNGKISQGIQINCDRENNLSFGIITDIAEQCSKSKNEYNGEGVISLDFGLSTLFASSKAQLLGQNWLKKLIKYDNLITSIAKAQQKQGKKPRDSKRYRALVQDLRGFIKTEINRIINKLIEQNKPVELILEGLYFQNTNLSRRLNRILQNCGRSTIKAKLLDIQQRFGIKIKEVNPAYTSQTCSNCGYVDKRNRQSQSKFKCLWCGKKMHADFNAALNIRARRACSIGSMYMKRASVLVKLVRGFNERRIRSMFSPNRTGSRDIPADPRKSNSYFDSGGEVSSKKKKSSKIKFAW